MGVGEHQLSAASPVAAAWSHSWQAGHWGFRDHRAPVINGYNITEAMHVRAELGDCFLLLSHIYYLHGKRYACKCSPFFSFFFCVNRRSCTVITTSGCLRPGTSDIVAVSLPLGALLRREMCRWRRQDSSQSIIFSWSETWPPRFGTDVARNESHATHLAQCGCSFRAVSTSYVSSYNSKYFDNNNVRTYELNKQTSICSSSATETLPLSLPLSIIEVQKRKSNISERQEMRHGRHFSARKKGSELKDRAGRLAFKEVHYPASGGEYGPENVPPHECMVGTRFRLRGTVQRYSYKNISFLPFPFSNRKAFQIGP